MNDSSTRFGVLLLLIIAWAGGDGDLGGEPCGDMAPIRVSVRGFESGCLKHNHLLKNQICQPPIMLNFNVFGSNTRNKSICVPGMMVHTLKDGANLILYFGSELLA